MAHLQTDNTNVAEIVEEIGLPLIGEDTAIRQASASANFRNLNGELLYSVRSTLLGVPYTSAGSPCQAHKYSTSKIVNIHKGLTARELRNEIALYLYETELTDN